MRKGIALAALCMLGALAFSSTVMAYDDLYTDDTAAMNAVGAFDGSVGLMYSTASKAWNADSKSYDIRGMTGAKENLTGMRLPIRVNFGIMNNITIFGILPVYTKWDLGSAGESGIGDIWLGAKYLLMPALTLRGALDLPTGDDKKELGNMGGFGVDVAAMSSYKMAPIDLNGQVGIRYNAEDGDTKYQPGLGIYLDAEAVYAFTEAVNGKVGFEFATVGDGKNNGNTAKDSSNFLDLKIGGVMKLSEKMGLGADLLYTLAGKSTAQDLTILVRLGCAVK